MTDVTTVNPTPEPAPTGNQPDSGRTFTQAELDAIITARLAEERNRERRRIESELGPLEALKAKASKFDELEAASLSEVDKLRKQLADLQAQHAAAEQQAREATLRAERLRVGQEMGLPVELAERLAGDDADTLKADAQKLLDSLKATGRPPLPNVHATEGALASRPSGIKLTPQQMKIADEAKMPYDKYVEMLQRSQPKE